MAVPAGKIVSIPTRFSGNIKFDVVKINIFNRNLKGSQIEILCSH